MTVDEAEADAKQLFADRVGNGISYEAEKSGEALIVRGRRNGSMLSFALTNVERKVEGDAAPHLLRYKLAVLDSGLLPA